MEHIKDFEFQEYFENSDYPDNMELRDHLKVCDSCRYEFEHYRQLYKSLKVEPEWSLPEDFADRVVSAIPFRIQTKFGFLFTDAFMYIACIVILLGTGIYYLNLKTVSSQVYNYIAVNLTLRPVLEFLNSFSSTLQPGMASYILTTGLVLIIIGIFDKFIMQRKVNRIIQH